jgi:hypothetical protein
LTEPNYTTSAEAQDYFRNMDMLVEALIDVGLWQPETNYPNGHVVFSPNMPNGTEAVCVATNGGKSSNTEPSWGEVGNDNVSDGTCFWKLRWKHWSKENATNRLPNATYAVDDVMLHKSNLSVALKCTTNGTTSADELDISGRAVGESVTDGSVVWEVVSRDTVAIIDKERPIKTFTSLEQLGLDNNASEADVGEAIPFGCILKTPIKRLTYPNFILEPKNQDFDLVVIGGNRTMFFAQRTDGGNCVASYRKWNKEFVSWEKVAIKGALSMPSDQYVNISCDFTSNNMNWQSLYYTAPCDGWIAIFFHAGTANGRSIVSIRNSNTGIGSIDATTSAASGDRRVNLPMKKGDQVEVSVVNITKEAEDWVRFFYAQSEV